MTRSETKLMNNTTNNTSKNTDHTFSKEMGNSIRILRKANNMTQRELAQKLGVSYQQIQKYERGVNRISFETLIDLQHIFHVPYEYFLRHALRDKSKEDDEDIILSSLFYEQIRHVTNAQSRDKIMRIIAILCS